MNDDATDLGHVVLVLNAHGVVEAFGPYPDEKEAHDVADFTSHLVPTWLASLDEGTLERYGITTTRDELPAKDVRKAPKVAKQAAAEKASAPGPAIVHDPVKP
jgi:hypothetical protein